MSEEFYNKAEIRRRRLLENSQKRMKKLLGEVSQDDISQGDAVNLEIAGCHNVHSITKPEIKIASNKMHCKQDIVLNDDTEKFSGSESKKIDDLIKEMKTVKTNVGSNQTDVKSSSLWLSFCIVHALAFSYYISKYPGDGVTFIHGYIVFLTIYLMYLILTNQNPLSSVRLESVIINVIVNLLNIPQGSKHALLNILKFFLFSINHFFVYSFFFFLTYKILHH